MTAFSDLPSWQKLAAYCVAATAIGTTFWVVVGAGIDGHIEAVAETVVKKQIERFEDKVSANVTQSQANGIAIQEILQEQATAKAERKQSNDLAREQRDLSRSILFELRKP